MSNYQSNKLSECFKALSNPHRLALFQRLCNCCEPGTACNVDEVACMCVGDLGEGLGIAASTLSHHLKELNRAGLVQMKRNGKNVECRVERSMLDELAAFFQR